MGRAEDIFNRIKQGGESAIDEFIETRQSEDLFLDFKRSERNGSGKTFNTNDRKNLAKAISGFGNSEGGVIVWGIDCSKDKNNADVAHTKHPIEDTKKFLSWIEGAVSGCTIPPHTEVQNHPIIINNQDEGFVATYIPKSMKAPHQVIVKGKSQHRYYIRAGSNFEPTPHAVLAGMFGHRPQPNVFHSFSVEPATLDADRIHLSMGFLINNQGPGIASDLFMNATLYSGIGKNCSITFNPSSDSNSWTGAILFNNKISMISKLDVRLPPEAELLPFTLKLSLYPPFTSDLLIDCICGSGQSPSIWFEVKTKRQIIEEVYFEFLNKNRIRLLSKDEKIGIAKKIFGERQETAS